MSGNSESHSSFLILNFSAISLFIISFTYFIGWFTIFYYLEEFGISIFSLEIPFHYFFVYSYAVFQNALSSSFYYIDWRYGTLPAIFLSILTILSFRFFYFWPRSASEEKELKLVVHTVSRSARSVVAVLLVLVAMFVLGYATAVQTASEWAAKIRFGKRPYVQIVLTKDAQNAFPKPATLMSWIPGILAAPKSKCFEKDERLRKCQDLPACEEAYVTFGPTGVKDIYVTSIFSTPATHYIFLQPHCGAPNPTTTFLLGGVTVEIDRENIALLTIEGSGVLK